MNPRASAIRGQAQAGQALKACILNSAHPKFLIMKCLGGIAARALILTWDQRVCVFVCAAPCTVHTPHCPHPRAYFVGGRSAHARIRYQARGAAGAHTRRSRFRRRLTSKFMAMVDDLSLQCAVCMEPLGTPLTLTATDKESIEKRLNVTTTPSVLPQSHRALPHTAAPRRADCSPLSSPVIMAGARTAFIPHAWLAGRCRRWCAARRVRSVARTCPTPRRARPSQTAQCVDQSCARRRQIGTVTTTGRTRPGTSPDEL